MRYPLDSFTISQGFHPGHQAIDLAAWQGTPVLSPMAGTVIKVGSDPKYVGGRYVIVRESYKEKLEHYTGHHSKVIVRVGDRVKEGQKIAEVGMTGTATGPHVHYQIRKYNYGELLNPLNVYKARNKEQKPMIKDRAALRALYKKYHTDTPDDADYKKWVGKKEEDWLKAACTTMKKRYLGCKDSGSKLKEWRDRILAIIKKEK